MLISPQNLAVQVDRIRSRINRSAESVGRAPESVRLVAVSKGKPAESIAAAAMAGVTDFGENYLQEALDKMDRLRDLTLVWHFIGQVQSNKTRAVAQRFDWVHTIDRLKIAARLAQQRAAHGPPLNVCIQVKLVEEPAKGGIAPAELAPLAAAVARLPRIKLRGLMCVPPHTDDADVQYARFAQLARLRDELNAKGHFLDTLSMGMSEDFEVAIRAGATQIRIGTALFGER
jgi:PLP dependent protein